ncbi:HNH endonuclease signature motif containing protein [Lentzea sp. NEAU-D7]|uniref:HNH endonuclease signature motif containing protein n=1 Tax=Lentzea sp. NEAU-D7 TaxID=2994667 RepID=UPI00224A9C8B|nr:HNH endonuclease signature motif containing protein [Lentzea sp. NEAU-D7]MCX2950196.1 HNH endonuclease signature motif containing protein [Lentzea sp. NEAU-D7]
MGRTYQERTLKILFGRANRCAYPGCGQQLIFEDRGRVSVVAQIAHIRSESFKGPRHVPGYRKVNSEENLLLLCGVHHKPVDDHESTYSIDELLDWKRLQTAGGTGLELADHQLSQVIRFLSEVARGVVQSGLRMRSRADALDIAARKARARRVDRLIPFVPEERLDAVLAWMKGLDDPIVDVPAGSVRVLVAPLGAGKSEQALRWWEDGLQTAADDPEHELPQYFTARTVVDVLEQSIADNLGGDPVRRCRVVVDELDGVSIAEASGILSEARQLVQVWPQVSILATTRPGIPLGDKEKIVVPRWTVDRGAALVELALGDYVPHRLWTAETSDLLTSPLTALALAARVHAGRDTKVTRSQLLADLATQVLESHGKDVSDDTWNDLARLAVAVLEEPYLAEGRRFGPPPRVRRLIETGLVVHDGRQLTFALPVFEQYFASQAIALGLVSLNDAAGARAFPRWRYALAFAVTTAAPRRQEELLTTLARVNPAAAFWVLGEIASKEHQSLEGPPEEAIAALLRRRDVTGGAVEPDLAIRAGLWLRDAEKALLQGIGPLAHRLARHRDGQLTQWGAWLKGGRFTLARARDRVPPPEVIRLAEPRAHLSQGWHRSTNFSFPTADFGRWQLAQDSLQRELNTTITRRKLQVPPNSWLARERTFWLGKFVVDHGRGRPSRFINVAELRETVAAWKERADAAQLMRWGSSSGREVDGDDDIRWLSAQLATEESDVLAAPWPEGDIDHRGRWVWQGYSPELTLTLATAVVREALVGYRQLVEQNFPTFGDALGLYSMMPLRVDGLVGRFAEDEDATAVELRLLLDPTPTSADNESPPVHMRLITSRDDQTFWEFGRDRQQITRAAFKQHVVQDIDLPLHDSCAATTVAYEWLARDLAAVGWLKERW